MVKKQLFGTSTILVLLHTTILLSIIILAAVSSTAQKFDPYQLNGGLVAAVAGRDYVLIASDTRLTDGGYGVHSRRYLSGRLWSASSSSSSSSSVGAVVTNHPAVDVPIEDNDKNIITRSDLLQSPSTTITTTSNDAHWNSDGSLLLPSIQNIIEPTTSSRHFPPLSTTITTNPPIIIGSAGCASDCESLKRRMRLELDGLNNHNNNNLLCVSSVANLLQQILYSRRGFPYYSFCVVAGLIPPELLSGDGSSSRRMEGAVYVYDAIGSFERVAVGSAGTGRELLQPILDQLFSGGAVQLSEEDNDDNGDADQHGIIHHNNHSNNGKSGDIMAIPPMKQRVGVAGSLRPPVETTVSCTVEDAVKNVARAYQSVAEREISVGDEVVICVVRSATTAATAASVAGGGETTTDGAVLKVYRYPLKKH